MQIVGEPEFDRATTDFSPTINRVFAYVTVTCRFHELDGCPGLLNFRGLVVGSLYYDRETKSWSFDLHDKVEFEYADKRTQALDYCSECGAPNSLPRRILTQLGEMAQQEYCYRQD